jgi:hypothetical protein
MSLRALAVAGAVAACAGLVASFSARSDTAGAGSGARSEAAASPGVAAAALEPRVTPQPVWDTEEIPGWKTGVAMRPMDRDVVAALRSGRIERTSMLDLFPDRAYRVRLTGSARQQQFRWVLVDWNRDGVWDERWDLGEPGQILRTVTHDPDSMGHEVMYTLTHGRWLPH